MGKKLLVPNTEYILITVSNQFKKIFYCIQKHFYVLILYDQSLPTIIPGNSRRRQFNSIIPNTF